jgi:hypothetical protein
VDYLQMCARRVWRALEHKNTAASIWNRSNHDELFKASGHFNPKTAKGRIIVTLQDVKLLASLSLEIGEMLYQLRSALDGLIYGSAVLVTKQDPPPSFRSLYFPICSTADDYRKSYGGLSFLPDECKQMIASLQPFANGQAGASGSINKNNSFALLGELSRIDRHRMLNLVRILVVSCDPLFRLPDGMTVRYRRVQPMTPVEHGDVIADYKLINFVQGQDLAVNPNVKFGLGLAGEPEHTSEQDHFGERAQAMIENVAEIVDWFVLHFTPENVAPHQS